MPPVPPPTPDPANWTLKRIGIIGAGAMGTSLAALAGQHTPVVMVCRNPARAAQLFQDGARVTGLIHGHSRPIIVRSVSDLAQVGGVSALFVTTKTSSIPEVAAALRPVMSTIGDGPGAPFVVSYQNGIDPGLQLVQLLGDTRVLRMVLNFGAALDRRTGVAHCTPSAQPHYIGSPHPEFHPVCVAIADRLTASGLQTVCAPNIEQEVWSKAIVNAAINPVAALINSSISQVLASPARQIVERLMAEGLAVSRAERLDLGDDFIAKALRSVESYGDHVPSMVEDIRAGHESEVGQLNHQIIAHGRRLGVPTPTHEVIDALIGAFDWKIYAGSGGLPAMPGA